MTSPIFKNLLWTCKGRRPGLALVCVNALLISAVAEANQAASPPQLEMPVYFEANAGQANHAFQFVGRPRDGIFCLKPNGAAVTFLTVQRAAPASREEIGSQLRERQTSKRTVAFEFLHANPDAAMSGSDQMPGKVNYFIGNDPQAWRANLPMFSKVKVKDLYPGIDLIYYGSQRDLEYDFIIAPGARPSAIAFEVRGADRLELDSSGELVLHLGKETLRQHKPVIYQENDGVRTAVTGGYRLQGNKVSFELSSYDPSLPLIIDPTLSYSRFLGGSGSDIAWDVALGSDGAVYLAGETLSANLPVTIGGGYRGGFPNAGGDAFVAKLDPGTGAIDYLTYLGGSGDDAALGIAVDSSGSAYITGVTDSSDFPVPLAFSTHISGVASPTFHLYPFDAFVTKLQPDGTLAYSTYLGGNGEDEGIGIAVDAAGIAYVTGYTQSTNFPTNLAFSSALHGTADAFVAAVATNAAGTQLELRYCTYLGGTNVDHGGGIAVTPDGSACVTGWTRSTDFPTNSPIQSLLNGRTNISGFSDAFVTKFNPSGAVVFSTFLGGTNTDTGFRIAVDSDNSMYIAGSTLSGNFPVSGSLSNAHSPTATGTNFQADVFLTKLSASGSNIYSVVFGGTAKDEAWSVAVDAGHNAFLAGTTASTNFFTVGALDAPFNFRSVTNSGQNDAFVAAVNSDASAFWYSVYLGGHSNDFGLGIAVDPAGNAFVCGDTVSAGDFPLAGPASSFGSTNDAFIAKIAANFPVSLTTLKQGQNLLLRWPAFSPQYSVESSASAAAGWTFVAAAPLASNGWHTVSVGVTNGARQFRLRRD